MPNRLSAITLNTKFCGTICRRSNGTASAKTAVGMAAAHSAGLLDATAGPNRGNTSRESSSQHTIPAIKSGRRIHRLASLTWVISASRL